MFDSVVDDSAGLVDDVRSLRFARGDCEVELAVRGHVFLSVDIEMRPDADVTVAALAKGHSGEGTITWLCGHHPMWLPSGLTSFLFHWRSGAHRPARTAWLML